MLILYLTYDWENLCSLDQKNVYTSLIYSSPHSHKIEWLWVAENVLETVLKNATLSATQGTGAIHNNWLDQQVLVSLQKKKRTWTLLNHINKWSQLII